VACSFPLLTPRTCQLPYIRSQHVFLFPTNNKARNHIEPAAITCNKPHKHRGKLKIDVSGAGRRSIVIGHMAQPVRAKLNAPKRMEKLVDGELAKNK